MDSEQSIAVLEALIADKGEHLLRTAILLAGSRAEGEDLLQAALERVFKRWRSIRGDPEGYLRRTLHHLAIDGWRAKQTWRARLRLLAAPEAAPDMADAVDQRDRVVRLLRQLPPRQRTAVVLRYWEDLSEAETAKAMNCSVGTVKSAASRGLAKLRELSGDTGLAPPMGQAPVGHPDGAPGLEKDVRTAGRVA
jgi:RNA polymerase sigma-70 factor (sigma-E family)